MEHSVHKISLYRIISIILLILLAALFIFPLYWIITGSFKTRGEIISAVPSLFPKEWTMDNYLKLWEDKPIAWMGGTLLLARPIAWTLNTVFICTMAMAITCITASMAGYALSKKEFAGKKLIFSIFICAMALPKQVILIPLLKEMAFLRLHDTLWSVVFPTVGWPFGVFLMKQFSENIPGSILEAARIDGAGETRTFTEIVLPMIKPGIGALAIFTFITAWNDYFMQLLMLVSRENWTISLGIAKLQDSEAIDFGLIMAGAAIASVPIVAIFLAFQRFFTRGITMGAVKG